MEIKDDLTLRKKYCEKVDEKRKVKESREKK